MCVSFEAHCGKCSPGCGCFSRRSQFKQNPSKPICQYVGQEQDPTLSAENIFLDLLSVFCLLIILYLLGCDRSAHGTFHAVCGTFSRGVQSLSCVLWDLGPPPRIEPWPLALGARSLSYWTTWEVP